MPNICEMTVADAEKILEEYSLKIKEGEFSKEDIIKEQIPEYGVKINKEKEIIIKVK